MAFLDLEKKDVMTALAKEIAIAQLTAADDLVNEGVKAFTEADQKRVPGIGETHRDGPRQGQPITSAERYEIFRSIQPFALAAAERERVAEEKRKEQLQRIVAEREAREAQEFEAVKLQYDADLASWKANQAAAKANGYQFSQPEPSAPPKTLAEYLDQRARQAHRNAVYSNF